MTVYDFCHVGHARVFVAFDMIVRYLRSLDYDVHYVRNITDIDDKIIKRAQENGETCSALTERFIDAMHEDEAKLGVLRPDEEPKATDFMQEMVAMIEVLMEKMQPTKVQQVIFTFVSVPVIIMVSCPIKVSIS